MSCTAIAKCTCATGGSSVFCGTLNMGPIGFFLDRNDKAPSVAADRRAAERAAARGMPFERESAGSLKSSS